MSKHTPGPWSAQAVTGFIWPNEDPGKGTIAAVNTLTRPEPEVEANARLIAAAPDLLAALKDMTDVAEKAIVAAGSDAEYAAIRVASARAVFPSDGAGWRPTREAENERGESE